MPRSDFGQMHCSIARTMDVIGDPWTPLIIRDLLAGLDRFDDLVTDLGISRNLLAQRLRHLEDHGVVARRRYQTRPDRYRYTVTEAGEALGPVLLAVATWGDRWAPTPGGPPVAFVHRCGSAARGEMVCEHCGEPMTASDTLPVRGPGAKAGPGTWLLAGIDRPPER